MRYSRSQRASEGEPLWIYFGESADAGWKLGLGDRRADSLEVVIDVDPHDRTWASTTATGFRLTSEDQMSATIVEIGAAQRLFVGATASGAEAVVLETEAGEARPTQMIRASEVRSMDFYFALLGPHDRPSAHRILRRVGGEVVAHRYALPSMPGRAI